MEDAAVTESDIIIHSVDTINVDDRVKVIVLFLNEVYQHYGDDTNKEKITNIYNEVFGNKLPDYKKFFESIYKNKKNTQALLKLEPKFFELLKSVFFDDLQGSINKLYNTFKSISSDNLNRNFSIDTNSLESILQVMIYYDKNKLINFDDLEIKDDEILFTDQSLKNKIEHFPELQSDFIKKHPEYKYIQDYINLHKTIDDFRAIYYGANNIHYNNYKLDPQNLPKNILQIIDTIIKYSIKYFRLKIKDNGDIFHNLIDHFNKIFKDYDISNLFDQNENKKFENWILAFIDFINEFVSNISDNLNKKFEDPGFFNDNTTGYESEIEIIRNINDYNISIDAINSLIKDYEIKEFLFSQLFMEMHNFIEEYQKQPNNNRAEQIINDLCIKIQSYTKNEKNLDIITNFLEKFINTIRKNKKRAKQDFILMKNTLINTELSNSLSDEEYITKTNDMKKSIIDLINNLSELNPSLSPSEIPQDEPSSSPQDLDPQKLEDLILKNIRQELKPLGNDLQKVPQDDIIIRLLQLHNNSISTPTIQNQDYINKYNEIIEKLKDRNDHTMMDKLLKTTLSPLISP